MINVAEDFLEINVTNAVVWMSNLYVTLPGMAVRSMEEIHMSPIGVRGGDLYITDMTFDGGGKKAHAIDVEEYRRVYVGRAFLRSN